MSNKDNTSKLLTDFVEAFTGENGEAVEAMKSRDFLLLLWSISANVGNPWFSPLNRQEGHPRDWSPCKRGHMEEAVVRSYLDRIDSKGEALYRRMLSACQQYLGQALSCETLLFVDDKWSEPRVDDKGDSHLLTVTPLTLMFMVHEDAPAFLSSMASRGMIILDVYPEVSEAGRRIVLRTLNVERGEISNLVCLICDSEDEGRAGARKLQKEYEEDGKKIGEVVDDPGYLHSKPGGPLEGFID